MEREKTTHSLEELPAVASWILEETTSPILLFKGEMGAGKTTLIKELCRAMNVEDEVSSPTFSLVNEYRSPEGPVYHFDFYRLDDEEEAMDIGLEEYFYSGDPCLVEWPQKIRNLIPHESALVQIEMQDAKRTYRIIQPTDE
jgi:tRNA threonylcarbamoyladenosine biosynthesis protein TsaE